MVSPRILQTVMARYECNALEAYQCLRSPARNYFLFSNGNIKEPWKL
jgi:hypothetical protein